jgi:hypothetical protein
METVSSLLRKHGQHSGGGGGGEGEFFPRFAGVVWVAVPLALRARRVNTGAGADNGIDHDMKWLRFPYDSTRLRSH